jgi:lipopolysaccharide transport system permease protein
MSPAEQSWTVNAADSERRSLATLREVWSYRDLALFLVLRDIKLRYRQTFFGVAWVALRPLIAMGLFAVFLGRLGGVPSDGLPYAVFVLAGLTIWLFVASAVESASESLAGNRALIEKVYFPRMLAPISAVLATLVDLAIALVLLCVISVASGVYPSVAIVSLPVWLAAAVAVAVAIGLWLAALNVLYRDVRYTVSFLLQAWLFASPVIFPSSIVGSTWRPLLALNPLTGVLDGFRWSMLDAPAPPAADLVSLASGVAILLSGWFYFQRAEQSFADRI